MTNIALFLGAGASKPFGYPLTFEILPRIVSQARSNQLFAGDRRTCQTLLESLRRLFPGVSFKRAGTVALPQITDVLSLLDRLALDGYALSPDFSRTQVVETRRLLERATAEVLNAKPTESRLKEKHRQAWARALVRATERGDRVSVLSTNYDLVLELALYKQLGKGKMPSFHSVADRVDFGFDWRIPSGNEPIVPRPRSAALGLYKLHGSLNWLRCEQCGYVYINPAGAIFHQEYVQTPNDNNSCICGSSPLRAVLVTPSIVREIRDGHLLSVWSSALEALRTADRWIFVGYSLPGEDVSLRSIMLRAWNGRKKGSAPTVDAYLFKPDPGVRTPEQERYEAFFPGVRVHAGGAEEYIKDLIAADVAAG